MLHGATQGGSKFPKNSRYASGPFEKVNDGASLMTDLPFGQADEWSRPSIVGNPGRLAVAAAALAGAIAVLLLNSESFFLRPAALAIVLGGCALWGIRYALANPSWLIFALVMEEVVPYLNIIPIDPGSRWFLRYPLLLPLTIPAVWWSFRSRALFRGDYRLFVVFWGWALIGVARSLNPTVSLGRLVPAVLVFGTLVAVADEVNSADDLERLLGRFVLACGLVQILDVIAYFILPQVLGGSGNTLRAVWMTDPASGSIPRFAGVLNNPNAVGAMMTATVLSGVAHWKAIKKPSRKALLALSIAASIYFAALADSRSEIAAGIVGCIAWGIWRYRWRAVPVLAVIVLFAVIITPFVNPEYLNRGLDTATGRTVAWSFEWQMVKARPILGYGYQVEGEIFNSRYWTDWQDFWSHGANTPLHNGYMSIVIGLGIPGLLLWLIAFFAPWRAIFQTENDPWSVKQLFFLTALPIIFLSFDESVAEPHGVIGVLVWTSWAIAVRRKILIRQQQKQEASEPGLLFGTVLQSGRA